MTRRVSGRSARPSPRWTTRSAGLLAEDVAHRHAELGDERVEGADRRVHAVELDLRDEARRDADATRELAEADSATLSLRPETAADLRRLEVAVEGP